MSEQALPEPRALRDHAAGALKAAVDAGASAAEVNVSAARGLSVRVRGGAADTVAFQGDRALAVTAYRGRRTATVSTTELAGDAVVEAGRRAAALAAHTGEDAWAGLADPEELAHNWPELDLYHPWELDVPAATELGRACEAAALAAHAGIDQVESASVETHERLVVYANTEGFVGHHLTTDHGLACAAVARDRSGMQRDHWYTRARTADDLLSPETVGRRAGERAGRRLGARAAVTGRVPVVFPADLARGLLGHLAGALGGGALYRDASFLKDRAGDAIFPAGVDIVQRPHLPGALGSAAFDAEGVATRERDLVADGVLRGYLLDSYAARRLGLRTTGNAGGVFNLELAPGTATLDELCRRVGEGLLVTELMGQGVSLITGDYSRGAAGFWIENGEVAFAVENATVAGNLADMFANVAGIGDDLDVRGSLRAPSLLIDGLTVGGR